MPTTQSDPGEAPPLPQRVSASLAIALFIVGSVSLYLAILASRIGKGAYDFSYRIASVVGVMALWPLIIVGLFSIGRQFRNGRARAIIVLVVWGLFSLGSLGNLSKARKSATQLQYGPQFVPPTQSFDYSPFQNFGSTPALVPRPPPVVPAPAVAPSLDYDFSSGSDKRLIDLIEHAQEGQYHAVVNAYAKACQIYANDPVLALERVRFIERFADADDFSIKSSSEDLAAAVDFLLTRFPDAPGTVLYKLRNYRDPGFEAQVQRYSGLVSSWPAEDRASFLLLRAQAANLKNDLASTESFSSASFESSPTTEAGLLLAKTLRSEDKNPESVKALERVVFDKAKPWETIQGMNLFFDLHEPQRAMAVYEKLSASSPQFLANSETAMRLAGAGQIEAARSIFRRIKVGEWNRAKADRERFRFELEFGSAEQARAAYRTLRAEGLASDPVLSERLKLFARHPALGWNLDDFLGLFLLGSLLLGSFVFPLLLLLPLHYWSLLRPSPAGETDWPTAGWGLLEAWLASGAITLAAMAGVWWYRSELVRSWWTKAARETTVAPATLLSEQTLDWVAMAAVLTFLFWRFRAWRLLGTGQWSLGRTVGMGIGIGLALRIGLGVYIFIWPQANAGNVASISAMTQQLCFAILKSYGPLGLIAVTAILVPILEEMFFRGVLLQAMSRYIGFAWANAGQALVFASLHGSLWLMPFFLAFGIAAGVLARRSGGLLASILAHALNNLMGCIGIIAIQRHLR